MSDERIGFIGVGVMGEPMCRNIAEKSGCIVTAFDLNPEPLKRLQASGVQCVSSIAEVVEASSIVFLSLPGGPQLADVCNNENGLLEHVKKGQTIVDTSTAPVALTRSLAEKFAALEVGYADTPIARTRQAAEAGTLSIMVGADDVVFRRIEPFLRCCATDITHCGDVGCGQVSKLLNNMVLFQNVVAIAEALKVARGAGLADEVLMEVLSKGSADSFALHNHGEKAMWPNTFPERAFPTTYAQKDLAYALELAQNYGLNLTGAKNAAELLERSRLAGNGDLYFPALAKVIGET
ncbi:MAG: NAD(P)-dependent oxidoreductase [Pseudomonadota bacterium]